MESQKQKINITEILITYNVRSKSEKAWCAGWEIQGDGESFIGKTFSSLSLFDQVAQRGTSQPDSHHDTAEPGLAKLGQNIEVR